MFIRGVYLLVLTTGFASSVVAQAEAPSATYSRQTITLSAPALVGGIAVEAGEVQIFVPGGDLAHGTLSQGTSLQELQLPSETVVDMESPGRLASAKMPQSSAAIFVVAGVPFSSDNDLTFGYSEYNANFRGTIAYKPTQYPSFPTAGLNLAAFDNQVIASCTLNLDGAAKNSSKKQWGCVYEMVLGTSLEQKFGPQTLTIPSQTLIHFDASGIGSFKLAKDEIFMGLPVSAASEIRLNNWTVGGAEGVVSLMLSQDATYKGYSISAKEEVNFFDTLDASGPALESFDPLDQLPVPGAGGFITVAPLSDVHLNRDGSLHYGNLAYPQSIQGILFPENALVFLGEDKNSGLSSVGLQPFTSVVIDGVTYGNSIEGEMFIDFDEAGHVKQVRD